VTRVRTVFGDLHITTEDLLADGDKVVCRTSASATHRGELKYQRWGAFAPTGKRLTWTETCIFRFEGGKIAEQWWETDWGGLLVQLGVVVPPGS
jgi:predicted ester cyclase